ncbi:TPA: toll/interleukin-1 receptor domain-containing protein [Stenotrophomonas maltophilia]|nr:toll/interleukin-1 receptor domain-containing protein [Stenotrophomonas maltophilia]
MAKVFLSWSGDLSQKLAESLRGWMPTAFQFMRPYFTPDDIEKGAKWNSEISKELESCNTGIIFLTKENLEKPWILFEAGALSKSIEKSRVCTLLFDVEPSDVKGPLTSFQATRFEKADFKKLMVSINANSDGSGLTQEVFDEAFEMWWPKLESKVAAVIKNSAEASAKTKRRPDREILDELLELARLNSSRQAKSSEPRKATLELIDAIEFMLSTVEEDGFISAQGFVSRIDRPLRHLYMELGIPEGYDRFRLQFNPRRSGALRRAWPPRGAERESVSVDASAVKSIEISSDERGGA